MSAAEAELGVLFMNTKEGCTLKLTLKELGHPHPATPIHCDNTTMVGITNGTLKQQRSWSMEMRFFYMCDQVLLQKLFDVQYHPGLENLGDYSSKHHDAGHHIKVFMLNPPIHPTSP